MVRKHNFILKGYAEGRQKRNIKSYKLLCLFLFCINVILFQYFSFIKDELERYKVQMVSVSIPNSVGHTGNESEGLFDIYEYIVSSLNSNIKITNFIYENNNIHIELKALDNNACISFIKNIEESEIFEIISISPIEKFKDGVKFRMELIQKVSSE